MKRKTFIYISILSICVTVAMSCKKATVGFISPNVHYEQNPISVPKGRAYVSDGLNLDGTSQPYSVRVLHYYNKATGANVDNLFSKTYPVNIWTGLYNPKVDLTLASIQALQKTVNITPISINPASGQLIANYGALQVPAGEYQFDLELTNSAGTKVFSKIGDFVLVDAPTYDAVPELGTQYNKLYQVGNETKTSFAKPPVLTITRTADATDVQVTLQFLDKNGKAFNPNNNEIQYRPLPGLSNGQYLDNLATYALKTTTTDNSIVYQSPIFPFPLNPGPNGYNMYYRIPTSAVHSDTEPDGKWSYNPRFPVRFYVPGKYLVTLQFPDLTHVP